MTNLKLRLRITLLVVKIQSAFAHYWVLRTAILRICAKPVMGQGRRIRQRRLKELTNLAANIKDRSACLLREAQSFSRLPEDRKARVLAGRAVLVEDCDHLLESCSQLKSYRTPGEVLLISSLTRLHAKLDRKSRDNKSLERIILRLDSDTFYWDLFLRLVVPGAYSEELLGDLNEEYQLRNSSKGVAHARAWYRHQVRITLKSFLSWITVERLAAISTLIDFIIRWFKK